MIIIIMRWRRWRYQLIALLGIKLLLPSVQLPPLRRHPAIRSGPTLQRWVPSCSPSCRAHLLGQPRDRNHILPSFPASPTPPWKLRNFERRGIRNGYERAGPNRLGWIYVRKPITIMRRVHRNDNFFLPLCSPTTPSSCGLATHKTRHLEVSCWCAEVYITYMPCTTARTSFVVVFVCLLVSSRS